MGYLGPVCVLVHIGIYAISNKRLMSPVASLGFQLGQLEEDFR